MHLCVNVFVGLYEAGIGRETQVHKVNLRLVIFWE